MDIKYYREFNKDLQKFYKDNDLMKYFEKYNKKEERIYNEKSFYIKYPDFDYIFYRNINIELNNLNKFELEKHYHFYGYHEKKICSLNNFLKIYSDFNIYIYKILYNIFDYNDTDVYLHFIKIGIKENYIYNIETFNNKFPNFNYTFNIKYPDFDLNFYSFFIKIDCENKDTLNFILKLHYDNIGYKNNLYYSEKFFLNNNKDFISNFYKENKDFDIIFFKEFYKFNNYNSNIILMIIYNQNKNLYKVFSKKIYDEIINNFDINLYNLLYKENLEHFINIGIYENFIYNYNSFILQYPEFNIKYYIKFNDINLNIYNTDNLIIKHYLEIGYPINQKYFNCNFEIKNYYENSNYNFLLKDKNIENLYENINNYYISSKQSFLKYYSNFDIEYYKYIYINKFENTSEIDILYYYHTIGKYNKDIINNKLQIIIYTPTFDINCDSTIALHYLAKLINEIDPSKYYCKLFNIDNLRYSNIFCNDFAEIYDVNNNTIVIYPETISDNPLNAKNVVRWILFDLDVENLADYFINWDNNDLLYFWKNKNNNNPFFKQLACQWLNPVFKNEGLEFNKREKTCFLIKKGRLIHKDINYYHDNNSICLDNISSLNEKSKIFNECKYFYCYDPNSIDILFAGLCGCIPIVYPLDSINKEEYMKNSIYNCGNNIIDIGFAYGNSDIEINNAINNNIYFINNVNSIVNYYKNTINFFCNNMYNLIYNNLELTNIVNNYYLIKEKNLKKKINNNMDNINDLDITYYKHFNKDLFNFNNKALVKHFYKNHINENRIYNEHIFYEKYNDFNHIIYTSLNNDISNLSKFEAEKHFHLYGRFENRIYNINQLIEHIEKIDNNIILTDNINNIVSIYNSIKNNNNNNNIFDFNIESYIEPINNNNIYFEKIFNHYFYRKIKNIDELIEYQNKNKKNINIFTKKDFYKYYSDFNIKYYKNKYLSDEISEKDVLKHYINIGRPNKYTINNKLKIVIYTPIFDINCGGIVALHNFAKVINKIDPSKYYCKLFNIDNLRYSNIFCNDFAEIYDIDDNTVVIYPETIFGNPLNAKNVVRWILLDLGIEMPSNHYINWNKNDLLYFWETKNNNNPFFKQLACQWLNPVFKNEGLEFNKREKTCFLIKKGRLIHKDINYYHDNNSICLDNISSLKEKCKIFNECKYFYCYDPNSMYVIFAGLCGCIPIVYPLDGINKEKYLKNRIYNCGNNIIDIGFAYGNSDIEINKAIKKNKYFNVNINKILNYYYNTVNIFINELYNKIYNNININNTVNNYFYI